MTAWKEFALHPLLEHGLALLGFSQPTEVQRQCLPAAVRDRLDVIGAAQTGSGKTLAFGLPIMQLLMQVGGVGGWGACVGSPLTCPSCRWVWGAGGGWRASSCVGRGVGHAYSCLWWTESLWFLVGCSA